MVSQYLQGLNKSLTVKVPERPLDSTDPVLWSPSRRLRPYMITTMIQSPHTLEDELFYYMSVADLIGTQLRARQKYLTGRKRIVDNKESRRLSAVIQREAYKRVNWNFPLMGKWKECELYLDYMDALIAWNADHPNVLVLQIRLFAAHAAYQFLSCCLCGSDAEKADVHYAVAKRVWNMPQFDFFANDSEDDSDLVHFMPTDDLLAIENKGAIYLFDYRDEDIDGDDQVTRVRARLTDIMTSSDEGKRSLIEFIDPNDPYKVFEERLMGEEEGIRWKIETNARFERFEGDEDPQHNEQDLIQPRFSY